MKGFNSKLDAVEKNQISWKKYLGWIMERQKNEKHPKDPKDCKRYGGS